MAGTYCKITPTSTNTNTIANTEDLLIEIASNANKQIKIKKIEICADRGVTTTTADGYFLIRILEESAAGSGGAAQSKVKLDVNSATSTASAVAKNGTTNFSLGTVANVWDIITLPQNFGTWQFVAIDDDDKYVPTTGNIFTISVKCPATSQGVAAYVEWEED
jgi:hypothetical protein